MEKNQFIGVVVNDQASFEDWMETSDLTIYGESPTFKLVSKLEDCENERFDKLIVSPTRSSLVTNVDEILLAHKSANESLRQK